MVVSDDRTEHRTAKYVLLEEWIRCNHLQFIKFDYYAELSEAQAIEVGDALTWNHRLLSLDLTNSGIEDKGAIAFGNALAQNTVLRFFNLKWNGNITGTGGEALANGLRRNSTLREFNLENAPIGDVGGAAMGDALAFNKGLRELKLYGNQIGEQGAVAIGKGIQHNTALYELNLSNNLINCVGAESIAAGLEVNNTLTVLTLSNNKIRGKGGAAIGRAIQYNIQLRLLSLQENQIGEEGAQALGLALQHNETLLTLNLRYNKLNEKCAGFISTGLKSNQNLLTLNLRGNQIGDVGGQHLVQALQHNTTLQNLLTIKNGVSFETQNLIDIYTTKNRKGIMRSFFTALNVPERLPTQAAKTLTSTQQKTTHMARWGRCKALFVGQPSGGKTAITRSLVDLPLIENFEPDIRLNVVDCRTTFRGLWTTFFPKDFGTPSAYDLARSQKVEEDESIELPQEVNTHTKIALDVADKYKVVTQGVQKKSVDKQLIYEYDESRLINERLSADSLVFNLWDFKGTRLFTNLYSLCFSKQAIYVLVFDLTQTISRANDGLQLWLHTIKAHSQEPTLFLVGTRLDKFKDPLARLEEANTQLRSEHPEFVAATKLSGSLMYPVACSDMRGVQELRDAMEAAAREQNFVQDPVPLRWFQVMDYFTKDIELLPLWISFKMFKRVAAKFNVRSRQELSEMLQHFHNHGTLMHFAQVPNLSNTIIMQPVWLVDRIAQVITEGDSFSDHPYDKNVVRKRFLEFAMDRYKVEGTATRGLLELFWNDEHVDILTDIMHDLLLLNRWYQRNGTQRYIIPAMIADFALGQEDKREVYDGVVFLRFEFGHVPLGLYERLMFLLFEYNQVKGYEEPYLNGRYCYFFFDQPEERQVLLEKFDGSIDVSMKLEEQATTMLILFNSIFKRLRNDCMGEFLKWEAQVLYKGEYVPCSEARRKKLVKYLGDAKVDDITWDIEPFTPPLIEEEER